MVSVKFVVLVKLLILMKLVVFPRVPPGDPGGSPGEPRAPRGSPGPGVPPGIPWGPGSAAEMCGIFEVTILGSPRAPGRDHSSPGPPLDSNLWS